MTEHLSSDRLRAILVLVATAAVIIFNFLAATGYVNGVTPAEVSDRYVNVLTPAGYAFTIWSLIYLGVSAFSVYQLLPANLAKFSGIRTLYLITCVLNCAWVYFWHHDQIVVCFLMIASLALVLFFIVRRLRNTEGPAEYLLVRAPFSIYFGWVTAATLVSIPITVLYLGRTLSEFTWTILAVSLILIAAGLGIAVRAKLGAYLYPVAIAWALTAIAVKQSGNTAVVVACAIGTVACLIAGFSFVVNLPSHSASQPTVK